MLTLRMVSRLSPSPLVRSFFNHLQTMNGSNMALLTEYGDTELELDEEGTRISLTIVDTPGFGDQIDNEAR